MTTRTLKKSNPKPADNADSPDPVDNDPGTNPNEVDSAEAEQPKTFRESGGRILKTLKKMASNRGVGVLNGFNSFLKKTGKAFNFFGNFLRDRAMSVKAVAKESIGILSGLSDGTSRGTIHLLNSGKVIGTQAGKEMYSTLQKATSLGKSIAKLGGTAVGTPLSIGDDVVSTVNRLAKAPSRLSKVITRGAINPVLNYLGPNSDEEQPIEEEEEEEEPPKASVKTPSTPQKSSPQKLTSKKPTK